ncbi:MAG: YcxB family protein, partial [Chloroflexaceae bacterium]|nr:YcxB family protein [Chloroflexaceae bacterium]
MVIESTLAKNQFIRIAISRHFQRLTFFFSAITCAGLTAFALFEGQPIFLLAGWIPFLLYIVHGVYSTFRAAGGESNPLFLPTRYELKEQALEIAHPQGQGRVEWQYFVA